MVSITAISSQVPFSMESYHRHVTYPTQKPTIKLFTTQYLVSQQQRKGLDGKDDRHDDGLSDEELNGEDDGLSDGALDGSDDGDDDGLSDGESSTARMIMEKTTDSPMASTILWQL
jgi:hypothetical protein